MLVLNVGGGANRGLPRQYEGWEQVLLDIDPAVQPDVVCDAKEMRRLPAAKYDAIYCSHSLEHFYTHEVPQVLAGFLHVLKPTGFAHIEVPDMSQVFRAIVQGNRDIGDIFYQSSAGPIAFHDVIYGFGKMVASGNLYYCHKTGFTEKSLGQAITRAGFKKVMTAIDGSANLYAYGFKRRPTKAQLMRLGL